MKICVLIKQVPDKDSKITINSDLKSIDTSNITNVINESDNYALEEALLLKEKYGGEVVVCTLGNESANEVIKTALAKGADRGIFLINRNNEYIDILSMAKIITKNISSEKFDIILSGLQSDDDGYSQLGVILSELLNMNHASLVMGTDFIDDKTVKVKRELENGWFQWSELSLPSSISIQSGINTPRYATLKGIMMVKNKTTDTFTASEMGVENQKPKVSLEKLYIPDKVKETVFIDGSPDEIAEKLIDVFRNGIKVIS